MMHVMQTGMTNGMMPPAMAEMQTGMMNGMMPPAMQVGMGMVTNQNPAVPASDAANQNPAVPPPDATSLN
jgi:hypothetical protein